jgi:hypothetical protein
MPSDLAMCSALMSKSKAAYDVWVIESQVWVHTSMVSVQPGNNGEGGWSTAESSAAAPGTSEQAGNADKEEVHVARKVSASEREVHSRCFCLSRFLPSSVVYARSKI